jgi:hypothetical protein
MFRHRNYQTTSFINDAWKILIKFSFYCAVFGRICVRPVSSWTNTLHIRDGVHLSRLVAGITLNK